MGGQPHLQHWGLAQDWAQQALYHSSKCCRPRQGAASGLQPLSAAPLLPVCRGAALHGRSALAARGVRGRARGGSEAGGPGHCRHTAA